MELHHDSYSSKQTVGRQNLYTYLPFYYSHISHPSTMSIISRSNPLNLQYRVCMVTSASTPLGVIICKTLLKANALVLGIDSRPKDDSLNAGLGTHFQFAKCNVNDERAPERIVEAAKEGFAVERIDVLVNVVEEAKENELNGMKRLGEVVRRVMEQEGKGSIVNVLGRVEGVEESDLETAVSYIPKAHQLVMIASVDADALQIDFTKASVFQNDNHGVRCNVVVPRGECWQIDMPYNASLGAR